MVEQNHSAIMRKALLFPDSYLTRHRLAAMFVILSVFYAWVLGILP